MPSIVSLMQDRKRALVAGSGIRKDSLNESERTIEIVFVTEDPQPMWHGEIGDYDEILDCSESAADLSRIRMGGALLSEHDRSKQIGVIEDARFENRVGIARVRFDTHALAEQEWQSVKNRIRRNFSVGYRVSAIIAEKMSEEDGNVFRATAYEPLEISLVSVPADVNCQAIREAKDGKQPSQPVAIRIPSTLTISTTMKRSLPQFFRIQDTGAPSGGGNAPAATVDPAEHARQVKAEAEKMIKAIKDNERELRETAETCKEADRPVPAEMLADAIDKGSTPDQLRKAVFAHYKALKKEPTPTGAHGGGIEIVREIPKNLRSIGEQISGAEDYKRARGTSKRAMEIKIPDAVHFRATLLTTTTTGYTPTLQMQAPVTLGVQQPTVADLMSQGVTNLGAYPYWQEDTLTNAATSVAEEGQKPEATFDLSQQSAPIIKLAVIGRVSDEVFDDVPSMESYVNNRLRYMVEIKEDYQLIQGAGGSDMTGIISTSGVQTQALGALTKPDAIRKAITKVQSIGFYAPDGMVVHPNDWEELCLLKDGQGQYLAGGPFYAPYGNGEYMAFQRFWGLRVVVTTSCPEGTAIVGAWSLGAMLLRRKGLTIDTTNSDGNDFAYNRIAIRAEERVGLAVWRPKAFCLVTGI